MFEARIGEGDPLFDVAISVVVI